MSYVENQLWAKGWEGTWLLSECIRWGGQKKLFNLKVDSTRGKKLVETGHLCWQFDRVFWASEERDSEMALQRCYVWLSLGLNIFIQEFQLVRAGFL